MYYFLCRHSGSPPVDRYQPSPSSGPLVTFVAERRKAPLHCKGRTVACGTLKLAVKPFISTLDIDRDYRLRKAQRHDPSPP